MSKFSRSKSSREAVMPTSMNDLRSYSTSAYNLTHLDFTLKELKMKKGNKSSRVSASSSKSWSFSINDPELQRKKRVASYKAYGMEGKMKSSMRKSFKWIKDKVIVHGFW